MMFDRIRAHFRRTRVERLQSVIAAHAGFLESVYRRRFPKAERARFELLWCEVAEVCRVVPDALHEDDKIADRCPAPRGWLSTDTRLDDLEYLVMTESRGMPPPKLRPETIGQVLDYLLRNRAEADD
jgi:hypothetical protein